MSSCPRPDIIYLGEGRYFSTNQSELHCGYMSPKSAKRHIFSNAYYMFDKEFSAKSKIQYVYFGCKIKFKSPVNYLLSPELCAYFNWDEKCDSRGYFIIGTWEFPSILN